MKILQVILGILIALVGIAFVYIGIQEASHGQTPFVWVSHLAHGAIAVFCGLLVMAGSRAGDFLRRLF